MRLAWVVLIAGCYTSAPAPTPISNRAEAPTGGLFQIRETSFGPITPRTQATLSALRAAFTGYEVRASNDSGLSYSVYRGTEKLAWIIPNDDGTIFNVHATSNKVEIEGRRWRVGSPFKGASHFTHCECWGDNPTCFRKGDHIAVNFERECSHVAEQTTSAFAVLDGAVVQRIIWSPKPFDGDDESFDDEPDAP